MSNTMLKTGRKGVAAGVAALMIVASLPTQAAAFPVPGPSSREVPGIGAAPAVAAPGEASIVEVGARKRAYRGGGNNAAAAAIIGGIAALGIGAAIASSNRRSYDDGYGYYDGGYAPQGYYRQGYSRQGYYGQGYYAQPQPYGYYQADPYAYGYQRHYRGRQWGQQSFFNER